MPDSFTPQKVKPLLMHKKLFALLIIAIPVISQAQLGGLLKKAKNKVEQRVENKLDNEMDKKLDQVEGKESPASNNNSSSSVSDDPKTEKETVKSYSKFDFVPGEKNSL